jgi:hypothetical protein
VALAAVWASASLMGAVGIYEPSPARIAGITLDSRRTPPDGMFDELAEFGVNQVAVVPYAFFRDGSLGFAENGRWFSESQSGAISLADSLREHGIGLVLKPQVWLGRAGFSGDLDFADDAEWSEWEAQYERYILHNAAVAESAGASWFVVGTELARFGIERPQFWRQLIARVRLVYSGPLTYAANWWGEVDSLQFWDDLDAIGVQAYYPLAEIESPSQEDLKDAWAPHAAQLQSLSRKWGKPILFTEIGYKSTTDAAIEPWAWTPRPGEAVADPELQARLYEAFFQGPWTSEWSAGAFIWKWYAAGSSPRLALDFSPQGKPAEEILRQAYQAEARRNQLPGDDR